MNENKRTAAYLIVAALAILIALEPWNLRAKTTETPGLSGRLFSGFDDPQSASQMTIVKYDENLGELHQFQVAKIDGRWSIPSHQNYPADAREHLAQAATALMGLEILGLEGSSPGQHELFGVISPDAKSLPPGVTGVGTRVTMKDKKDKVLADLIIGKEVKDRPELRYVRKPEQDQVYSVAVSTDKLSTKFADWIEKDLLKLNALDVKKVQLNDYSILESFNGLGRVKRSEIGVAYEDAPTPGWKLIDMVQFNEKEKPIRDKIKENEELNQDALNALKTALDDLQIVDIERKPKGMKGLQVVEDVVKDQDAVTSLVQRGFYPAKSPGGDLEVVSKEGEAICSMKDGVEYVLRFGQIAGRDTGDQDSAASDKSKGKKGDEASSKVNRYLFVMVQFNPDLLPKPDLQPLPEEEPAKTEKAGTEKKSDAGKKTDTKVDAQAAAEDAAEQAKLLADKRAAIEKENTRKQEEYDEKVKKGEEHAKELNNRFADWYYIISDDVYRKIHLGRGEVVKPKEAKSAEGEGGGGLGDLEKLKKGGLSR